MACTSDSVDPEENGLYRHLPPFADIVTGYCSALRIEWQIKIDAGHSYGANADQVPQPPFSNTSLPP